MTTITEPRTSRDAKAALPDLLTIQEVARARGRWHDATVRRHIASGVIPDAAVVCLPHRGRRASYRIKRAWLASVLAGKGKE